MTQSLRTTCQEWIMIIVTWPEWTHCRSLFTRLRDPQTGALTYTESNIMHLLFTKWMNLILIFSQLFRGIVSLSILTQFRGSKRFRYRRMIFIKTKSRLLWILCNGAIKIILEEAMKDKLVLISEPASHQINNPIMNTTCMKYTATKIAPSQTFKIAFPIFRILPKVLCLKQLLIGR